MFRHVIYRFTTFDSDLIKTLKKHFLIIQKQLAIFSPSTFDRLRVQNGVSGF